MKALVNGPRRVRSPHHPALTLFTELKFEPRYFVCISRDLKMYMNRRQCLIRHQTAKTENLCLSFPGLAGNVRVDSIQAFPCPFGMDFCQNSGEEPFESSQCMLKLLRFLDGCPGQYSGKDLP